MFQQDGSSPHFFQPFVSFEWPPRSPDLAPLEIHLKYKIYVVQLESLDNLMNLITNELLEITPEMLNNKRESFEQKLFQCMEVTGAHFQHELISKVCTVPLLQLSFYFR